MVSLLLCVELGVPLVVSVVEAVPVSLPVCEELGVPVLLSLCVELAVIV